MQIIRQINIKNRHKGYFLSDMTNIRGFDPSLLDMDLIKFKSNDIIIIYDVEYIKDFNSSNSRYLVFNNLNAYINKSGENKLLIFASTDKNKIVLGDHTEIWDEIKEQIELISGNKVKYIEIL